MKVKKVMTNVVGTCQSNETLAQVVGIMWQKDCGVVPIINKENKVIGIITDRDVAIAVTSRNRMASEILASEVISGRPVSCFEEDSVKSALNKMQKFKLKRLPILNGQSEIAGILSIADLLRLKKKKPLKKRLVKTLEAISKPDAILLKEI